MGYHPQQWWLLPQKLGSSPQEFAVLIPRTTSIPVPQATRCWPSGLRSAASTEATSLRPRKAFPRSSWLRCCFFDLLWTSWMLKRTHQKNVLSASSVFFVSWTYGVNTLAIESFRLKLRLGWVVSRCILRPWCFCQAKAFGSCLVRWPTKLNLMALKGFTIFDPYPRAAWMNYYA